MNPIHHTCGKYSGLFSVMIGFAVCLMPNAFAARSHPHWGIPVSVVREDSTEETKPAQSAQSRGIAAMRHHRWDEAEAELRKAVSEMPACAECWNNLGMALQFSGKLPEARKALTHAIHLRPGLWEAHINLALVWDALGFREKAAEICRDILDKPLPDRIHTLFLQAFLHECEGEWERAMSLYRACMQMDPGFLNPYWYLGRAYMANGHPGSALQVFRQGSRVDSTIPAFALGEAMVYARLGNLQKATSLLRLALGRTPKDTGLRLAVADLLAQKDDFNRADKELKKVLSISPGHHAAALARAALLFQSGDNAKALRWMREWEADRPSLSREWRFLMAAILAASGESAKADEVYEELGRSAWDPPRTIYWKGHYHLESGKFAAAAQSFRAARKRDRSFLQAYSNAAHIFRRIDSSKEEKREWNALLQFDSTHALAWNRLGDLYWQADHSDSAERCYRKSLALDGHGNAARVGLAYCLLQKDKADSARILMQEALAYPKSEFRALAGLGHLEMLEGNKREAIRNLRKAIQKEPRLPASYVNLYHLYFSREEWRKARKILDLADKKGVPVDSRQRLYADTWYEQGKYRKAQKYYTRASENHPEDLSIRFALAVTLFRAKQWEACHRQIQTLILDSSRIADVLSLRAQVLTRQKRYEEAIEDYEWLLDLDPDDLVHRNNLAWLYLQAPTDARIREAVVHSAACAKQEPENADYADTHAYALALAGNQSKAVEVLQKAIRLHPENKRLRKRLRSVERNDLP